MAMNSQQFQCKHLSSSEAGDYLQVMFAETREVDDIYLRIQRQFEFPDHGKCYVETNDPDSSGHYLIHNAQLTRDSFRKSFCRVPLELS